MFFFSDVEKEEITNMSIDFEELLNTSEELKPLIEKCMELCEPATFFKNFELYLKMYLFRRQFIENNKLEAQFNKKNGMCRIMFKDENSKPLIRVQWTIGFSESSQSFNESYQVEFTANGKICSIPYVPYTYMP